MHNWVSADRLNLPCSQNLQDRDYVRQNWVYVWSFAADPIRPPVQIPWLKVSPIVQTIQVEVGGLCPKY